MKRIRICILDDKPRESGLPKIRDLRFMTTAAFGDQDVAALVATAADDKFGVEFCVITPAELYSLTPAELAFTIFLVDVNWSDAQPEIREPLSLPKEELRDYGVIIAEWLIKQRRQVDPATVPIIFYSNSRNDIVQDRAEAWRDAEEPAIYDVALGEGQHSRPKLVEEVQKAYYSLLRKIVGPWPADAKRSLRATADIALQQNVTDLVQEYLIGKGQETKEIGEYRLLDLARPFVGFWEVRSKERGRSAVDFVKEWRALFRDDVVYVPPITLSTEGTSDPMGATVHRSAQTKRDSSGRSRQMVFVLRTMLRYGAGLVEFGEKDASPDDGLIFADFYLLNDEAAGPGGSRLSTDPLKAIENFGPQVLKSTSPKSDWNFPYPLLTIFSSEFGKEYTTSLQNGIPPKGYPPELFGRDLFDVDPAEMPRQEDALVRIRRRGKGHAVRWFREVQWHRIENVHLTAAAAVTAFGRDASPLSLAAVYSAWQNDKNHLGALRVLASAADRLRPELRLGPAALKQLACAHFETWSNRCKRSAAKVSAALGATRDFAKQAQHPKANERFDSLMRQLTEMALPRARLWERWAREFDEAGARLAPDEYGRASRDDDADEFFGFKG